MVVSKDLKVIAWKIFRGYVIGAFPPKIRTQFEKNSQETAAVYRENEIDLKTAQTFGILQSRKNSSIKEFSDSFVNLRSIAKRQGVSLEDIHELYLIAIVDYMLLFIFDESDSFADEDYCDGKRLDISFNLVLGFVDSALQPDFREMIGRKETAAIQLGRDKQLNDEELLKYILESNDAAISKNDFFENMKEFIRISRIGRVGDGDAIFKYFKIFLAHLFYKMGTSV